MVKAPSGHFHLMEDEPLPMVLIGGGIGITPMLSILNTVLESGINREIWLFYGVRNSNEHIMKEHLQTLARTYDNFHLHVCYSAPNENDLEGVDYQHNGRVSVPLLLTVPLFELGMSGSLLTSGMHEISELLAIRHLLELV